ncbi:MAG: ATPase, partial [Ruminococcus sp.]|nr:ATPase [Ruminococcus sp.]
MATEKMELVNINGSLGDLDKAIGAILESGSFHIEEGYSHSATGYKQLNEKNPYAPLLKRFTVLATGLGADTGGGDEKKCRLSSPEKFEELYDRINESYAALDAKRTELDKDIALRSEASLQTSHLKGMSEDISRLFTLEYIRVRFGRLPSDNAKKLEYFDRNFFFFPFDDDGVYTYGMYLCPKSEKEEIDEIFKTLFFERTRIPDFVKGNALKAYSDLQSEIADDKKDLELTESEIHSLMEQYREELKNACAKLKYLKGAFALRRKAGILKDKFLIKGFIPVKDKARLQEIFRELDGVELTFLPADSDSGLIPPTILKNGFLTRPFRMLVGMYGLPVYGGFDPTGLVAVTYSIMFGIMFGDLGQGFIVFLLGLILGRKAKDLGGMMTRCGFFSMVFGTLYGSVFGIEDLLDPMYESIGIAELPIRAFKQTNLILFTAVGIGIFLIVLSM